MPNSRNDQRDQNNGTDRNPTGKSNRGFAAMSKEEQREIARKGGEAVSRNREHMAEIGRRGGEASGSNRSSRANNRNNVNSEPLTSDTGSNLNSSSDINSGEDR
jgi:general stress protein YciG